MDIREIISHNLIAYRKQAKLTQQELAEQINYSDKAVSKWERGDGIPDVLVLKQIADFYGITLNDLLEENKTLTNTRLQSKRRSDIIHVLIALLSAGLVFLIATIAVVVCGMLGLNVQIGKFAYMIALPASIIVLLVFSCLWGQLYLRGICSSMLVWACCICFDTLTLIQNSWLIYLLGAALQILIILWFLLLHFVFNRKLIVVRKKK